MLQDVRETEMGISLGGHEIKMGPTFDGGESKLMQRLVVILTQIIRWDSLGSVPIASPNPGIFACCPGENHSTCGRAPVWDCFPRVRRVASAPLCKGLRQLAHRRRFQGIVSWHKDHS